MSLERLTTTAATAVLLAAAAFPFVVLFPDPPAFGPEALALAAAFATVATLAMAWRAERAGRTRILRQAAAAFAATAATAATNIMLRGDVPVPILDLLPGLFGLDGEDVDNAILFEMSCEFWLFWAVVISLPAWLLFRRRTSVLPGPGPWHQPARRQPWNAATVLLWAVGWCAMAGTVVQGHRTAAFLARADHAAGVIASDDAHPLIRFTIGDGTVVTFRQNGGISRAMGAAVPVAYDPADPTGTAEADTLFAAWGEIMGLAWIGLGFTLFPFFGVRATFGRR